jgi:tetratricopeptide (TPR) repeat protein
MAIFTKYARVSTLLMLLMGGVVLMATLHPIPTADLWWCLAMGRHIVQAASFPRTNIFSYTALHSPVIDHEWIPEFFFYLLYSHGGFPLLYCVKSMMIMAAVLVLFALARRRGASLSAASLGVICAVTFSKGNLYFDIRPYIFTYLFSACVLYLLEIFGEKRDYRLLLPIPFITWVWVNSHGAFILSFVLVFLCLFSHAVKNIWFLWVREKIPGGPDWKPFNALLATLAFSGGLALVNPYGLKLLLYPFSFMGHSLWKGNLIEWAPPDLFHQDLPFLFYYLATTALVVAAWKKSTLFELLYYTFFSCLALTTVRHITLFALFSIPLLALSLHHIGAFCAVLAARLWSHYAGEHPLPPGRIEQWAFLPCLAVIVVLGWSRFSAVDYRHLSLEKALFPHYGMEFIQSNRIPGPVYNPYEWGGYMLWKLYPGYRVFIDGRANTSYTEQVYRESLVTMFGKEGWEEILDRYKVNAVLCNKYLMDVNKEYKLGELMEKSHEWKLIYQDRVELLYLRITPGNSDLLRKAACGGLVMPDSPYRKRERALVLMGKDDFNGALPLLDEALRDDGSFHQLYIDSAYAAYRLGDLQGARLRLLEVIKKDRNLYLAHDLLGRVYEREGRIDKALKEYNRALSINPGFTYSRDALNSLRRRGVK